MKARTLVMTSVLAVLALLLSGAATAQGPQPPEQPRPAEMLPPWEPEFGKPIFHPTGPEAGIQSVGTASVPLGQPGLSFRYVHRFGVTEEGYIEDTSHFYNPSGVATDGSNVWIADSRGNRVVKFSGTGGFLQQIGKASFREATGTSLDYVSDVAVDSSGHIWVVDQGARHVAKFDSSGDLVSELGDAWNSGSDNSHFDDPIGIAFDGAGNVYISDRGNHRVQVFDSSGIYVATIGQTGVCGPSNSQFCNPGRIAIYASTSRLYVADADNQRVQIFDVSTPSSPTYVATLGISGVPGSDNSHFADPEGVAVEADYIYVADSNNNRVQIFNRITYAYVATIGGSSGAGNNQFRYPIDVAVDTAGNIYVADIWNNRVQQFDGSRTYARTYGTTGVPYVTDGYHYNYPTGVAVAADGSIYIVEQRGKRLIKLNAAGVPQWSIGEPGISGYDNSHFRYPNAVALDGAGHVYVADTENNRVQIYDSSGAYLATLGTGEGTGDDQFNRPYGVAVDGNGNIYVADRYNHRVQIFNSSYAYVATLGQTGVAGSDNGHFDQPYDVTVDSAGNIYVVDLENHRVQVFNSSRAYVRTIGETDVRRSDFGHLSHPIGVTVDSAGRIYVADGWGGRVQVFDSTGAYLTTIGGSSGNRTGQMRQADGLAVDSAGNLYIAEYLNHRIQKFAPGVPGWKQVNINGFGERANRIATLAPFSGQLYAGTYNFGGNGAQLWRTNDGLNWTAVMTNGFGVYYNVGIDHLLEFNGKLYAGVWNSTPNPPYTDTGGEIWRSGNGTDWEPVVQGGFGDIYNGEVMRLGVFDGQLYAGTWSYTTTHGAEIWRSATGDAGAWTQVVSNGFGDTNNWGILTMEEFNGALYVGTYAWGIPNGADVWRTTDGITWTAVITSGFGYTGTYSVSSLEVFGGYLYAGTGRYDLATRSYPGGQIWRCPATSGCDEASDWESVTSDGFGNTDNTNIEALLAFDNRLYAIASNFQTGVEVWRTADGTHWEQVGFAGFGDSNNYRPYWDNSVTVHNNRLYIGTTNSANGGEVWLYLHNKLYLPLVLRDF